MLAYLALGSNLGDRMKYLRDAVHALDDIIAMSNVYETDPVGGPSDQRAYLNMAVAIQTTLTPRELLGVARRLEAAAERIRREHWGPRTLDVDILRVGDLVVNEPDLTVPHPRMLERWFVLVPLIDIAPEFVTVPIPAHIEKSIRNLGPLFPESEALDLIGN